MGGTIPKCAVTQVGALWLLRGVGLWAEGYDGFSLACSLVFQAMSTCINKDLNLCAVCSLKCGESQLL